MSAEGVALGEGRQVAMAGEEALEHVSDLLGRGEATERIGDLEDLLVA